MYEILSCVTGEHGLLYVLAAILVLATGSVCSVIVYQRGVLAETRMRQRIWAGLSGAVTAIGIWATHFVAMLGYRPGFAFQFDGLTTLLSAGIALSGFLATSQILIGAMTPLRRATCALLATITVTTMHYYGVGALKASALIEFDTGYVITSFVAALALFSATYFSLSTESKARNVAALGTSMAAVASLHFIGMTAMTVVPLDGFAQAGWEIAPATLGSWVVLGVAAAIIAASVAAGWDTVLSSFRFREQRTMSLLVNAASEAILVVRDDGVVVEVNEAAVALFGTPRDALVGAQAVNLIGLDPLRTGPDTVCEHEIRCAGEAIPVDLSVRDLEDSGRGLVAVSLYDLRDRIRNEAHIRELAYLDQLTQLPNRAAFQKALDERTSQNAPAIRDFSVFLVDLDEFKDVNDQFGHEAGDAVLKESAQRLRITFGKDAIVSRLGGDEFAVIYPDGKDEKALLALGEACVQSLSRPIRYGAVTIRSGASVGIASGLMWEDPAALLKAADRALYVAKHGGRRTARFYDGELHAQAETKRKLESDLERAVHEEEFVLHYQSKVCSRTSRVLGFEALIRWNRPGHGLVMPGAFIEVAEQSLIIQDIGRWSIYTACEAAARWKEKVSVSVNLSARQFLDPKLYATVRDALRKSGLDASRLELEITETCLIQNTIVAARILERLKKLGVQIALDDFGTGYSSMRFVQQFPFDRIKIDKSFVLSMESDKKAQAIVDAILHLGSSLSIPVVAEGVETESQAKRLIEAHCSELQGFLLSRPAPLDVDGMVISKLANAS